MPAVIAFRRVQGGSVEIVIGEDADILDDGPDVVVVDNIKRWATASDKYVRQYLEWSFQEQGVTWPTWWDPDSRSIRLWNETVTVEDAIRLILEEAISRANLTGVTAEWRAGCPVNSDLAYRKALMSALSDLGCAGKIEWITEEPLLLLALGTELQFLDDDSSYLVYDLGGGSFDCAIAEVKDKNLIVYSEEGLPTLGGVNIDEALKKKLRYGGGRHDLRVAKEQLFTGSASSFDLPGGQSLTRQDVIEVLKEMGFIQKTTTAALDAYKKAKLLWKRPTGSPPYGELIGKPELRKSVWSLNFADMAEDVDRILVIGGPTLIPYFTEELENIFGKGKIITAAELVQTVGRADITEAQLTSLSHGACYSRERYIPLTVDRMPATISLKVTDRHATEEVSYQPYEKLSSRHPVEPYYSEQMRIVREGAPWEERIHETLHPNGKKIHLSSKGPRTYSLHITSPDGTLLHNVEPRDMRMPREEYRGPRADRIRLVVDRLGSVWVNLEAGFTNVPHRLTPKGVTAATSLNLEAGFTDIRKPSEDTIPLVRHPVWQTDAQREVIERLYEEQQRYEEDQARILHHNLTHNPFGHHERPG